MDIDNENSQQKRFVKVNTQYNSFPSYCKWCKLQGYNENNYEYFIQSCKLKKKNKKTKGESSARTLTKEILKMWNDK